MLCRVDTENVAASPTQRRVLVEVKRQGDATADELAVTLEISSSAVRRHLSALRVAGLITARQDRGQPGRPADRYHATDRSELLFTTSDNLSLELLEHIEQEDPALVDRVFDRRRHRLVNNAKGNLFGQPLDQRVRILTEMLDAQGYLADFEKLDDDHYRINLHSCPMWTVANRYRQACAAELDFLRDLVPDATVQRATHKTNGAHTCAYDIRPLR
jgi:DeoR family suf operon transcriptional repressor